MVSYVAFCFFIARSSFLLLLVPRKAVLCRCGIALVSSLVFEPAHEETYDKIVLPAKTGQSVHPPSMTWVLVYLFLDRLEAVEGICVQQRLIRLLGCTG